MKTILIVEDNQVDRKALAGILSPSYAVLEAADGGAALQLLKQHGDAVSAVVADLIMPEMDGFALLRRIRENSGWASLPVIIATMRTDGEAQLGALSLGASGFITKPYEPQLLLGTVANCIRLRETASTVTTLKRDRLTGLMNREAFYEIAEQMIHSQAPGYYTLSCFDIDSFKVVNDQYGEEMGDQVLKHVAACLQRWIQGSGGVCCRVMADQFALLYPSVHRDEEALRRAHLEAVAPACISRRIGIRIGRYSVDELSLPIGTMYDRAVMAQESTKGRYDQYIALYDETMRQQILHEQQIISEMYDALLDGQFEPWFQPQFNHATGAMIGAEALIRWRHPKDGLLIPPGDFIPIFERNGFIYELDKYVWEQTCRVLRDLIDGGQQPLPISINISRYDVFREDFVDVILALTEKYAVPRQLLWLEITESAFAESTEQIVAAFRRLIELGFTVEIDDFGSGYSSLNTLKDVPAAILKLDMKFLVNTADSQRGGNILESIIRMAKWLGMAVIAEGVETLRQADYLKSVGCTYVQGYLYARPMPLKDYAALAARSEKERKLAGLQTLETLDNNAFWDPDAMDTLIFNSYVGGACILEYHDGRLEQLRANDHFVEVFGGERALAERNPADYLDAEGLAVLLDCVRRAVETNREADCELTMARSGLPPLFLQTTIRVIARTEDRSLLYCVVTNTTEQRLAERRASSLSQRLQAILDGADCGMTAVPLTYDGSADYVFINRRFYELVGYTPEQYAQELSSAFDLVLPEDFQTVFPVVNSLQTVGQTGTTTLRVRRRDGRVIWLRMAISVIALNDVPVPVQLCCYTDITAERERDEQLQYLSQTVLDLMNKTPGGFVQMRILPDGTVRAEFCNDGFFSLVGLSREEAEAVYRDDVLAGVHPDDRGAVRAALEKMTALEAAHSVRCRLRYGGGGYRWVQVSGQVTRDKDGGLVLNAYYTDATEQVSAEEKQNELLDNLPYGAGLYEYDGQRLTAVHLNRRYWELVGRPPRSNTLAAFLQSVHPGDQAQIKQELDAAIRQGRDAACDLRILTGAGDYRPFHTVGRIVPKGDGLYAVYGAHTPISDEAMSIQAMLPIALQTMMSTQSDYSYIKDLKLHYISASRALRGSAGQEATAAMIGKTDYDLFSREVADRHYENDQRLLASGEPVLDIEEINILDDGKTHYFKASKYPLKDSQGNTVGIFGIGHDVTEARALKSQLELLTNSIPGGIAIYEAPVDTPDRLRLTFFTDGLCRLFGYDREEYTRISAADPLSLVLEADLAALRAQIQLALREGTPMDYVFRTRAQDGVHWVHVKAVRGEPSGDNQTLHAVLLDVSTQQETMERLRISEEENLLAIRLGGILSAATP